MPLNFEENIFPEFELTPDDNIDELLANIPKVERFFAEAPLHDRPLATVRRAKVDTGLDEKYELVENYQFVLTRRFTYNGELHVGGANGEILNVYLFVSNLKRFLEAEKAESTPKEK